MGVSRRILIQTAKEETFNIESDEKLTTRLLLDSGSEYTYITDNFRKLLKLKTKRTEKVLIKTFGQINGSQMQVLQNEFVFIEALCVPVIFTLLKIQEISFAQENY